jgi:hypothetical protein
LSVLLLATAGCTPSAAGPGPGNDRGALLPAPVTLPNAAVEWSEGAHQALVAKNGYANPMAAVRLLAMVHVAQHDALAAIEPVYQPYALTERAPGAHPVAAAASAAFEILASALPAQQDLLSARLSRSLEDVPEGPARQQGLAIGRKAAAAVLARRTDDGSDAPERVRASAEAAPGVYRPIPPLDFVFQPGWRYVRPFALTAPHQFRMAPPPALTSAEYAIAFNEVKAVGGKAGSMRSDEETAYAKFWYEFSDIGWNRVARVVATERKLGLQATARLFALLNMAMSDAYVAGWDGKVHYDFWRPTSAIRAAADDGNDATAPDLAWESAEVTPPVQDYPSTHSALGDAAAAVLAHVFGDRVAFSFTSTTALPGSAPRSFTSFTQAADENADSRVKAGLHFRFACRAGQALGRQVGNWVVENVLKPTEAAAWDH